MSNYILKNISLKILHEKSNFSKPGIGTIILKNNLYQALKIRNKNN